MIKLSLTFTLLVVSLFGLGQIRNIRFDNYTIEDGLSQSSVNQIIQDKLGFIWLGTQDGLNRFDGYDFKVFKHDPENKNTLSTNYITALCEDKKGVIWVGTESGGLNNFNPATNKITRISSPSVLAKSSIEALEIQDSLLWIGTKHNGLICKNFVDSTYTMFNESNGIYSSLISAIKVDNDGNVYVGTEGHGIFIKKANKSNFISHRTKPDGINAIAGNFINDISIDYNGVVWVGTDQGLTKIQDDKFVNYSRKEGLSGKNVEVVFTDTTGFVWCGYPGEGLDEIYFVNNRMLVTNYRHNDFNPRNLLSNNIFDISSDKTGTIWIGSNGGISKFDPLKQAFDHIKDDYGTGLIDKNIWNIFKENNNIIWVGTREGISRINRLTKKVNNYRYKGNNPIARNNNSVHFITKDKSGILWAATIDGLFELTTIDNYKTIQFVNHDFRDNQEGKDNRVYQIEEQGDYLWLACREGVARFTKSTGAYKFVQHNPNDASSISNNVCRAILADSKGNIWIGTGAGGLNKLVVNKLVNGKEEFIFKHYKHEVSNPNSISADNILSIWEEPTGELWLGTYGGGLNKYDPVTNQFTTFTEKNGLSNNSVYGVIGGEKGTLWLTTNQGASRFDMRTEVFRNFYASDGLQSNEFNTGAFHHSENGELFIGGINGFNAFYPDNIKINEHPPTVAITDILLFNKVLEPIKDGILLKTAPYTQVVNLTHNENNLTIKYTALHFTSPHGNEYKYVLRNNEEDFNQVSNSREAHYTNLDPGEYVFEVYAANSDGVWTETPAKLAINIAPPFWATWWFILILVLLAIISVLAFLRWRVNSIKAQKERLAHLVTQRTKTVTEQKEKIEEQKAHLEKQKALVEEEKAKADKLLANILPVETAEELKNKGKTRTRVYRRVTIMFTDFKGFTKIAERMKPQELVGKLDTYFREFDEIAERNHIEKIKTIGDSYMAAGGVPLRDKENPINTTIAALQIQHYVQKVKEEAENEDDAWSVRIGIHTGEVIAGVIGTKRIAYDIWGNSVNIAARMESSGEQDKVNISGKTYDQIQPYFDCVYRGKIAAKNKGHIDMYFVTGIKPHLSENGDGITPNKRFWEYLNLHVYSSINYRKAERHIMRILASKLSPKLYYHGIHHTHDVVAAAERLAIMEGVLDEDIFVLKSAATYHDAGFIEQYDANEPIGARLAAEILPKYGYTEEQVENVFKLIYATRIPHDPKSLLEEIICDADLDYLGRDDFPEIADTLRLELREHGKINSDRLWDEIQVKFLTAHKYFTKSAIETRQARKEEHLEDIKQRLIDDKYKD